MNVAALNVTSAARIDDAIISNEYHTYSPYPSAGFDENHEIRIPIQNQDGYTTPGDSYLVMQGKLTKIPAADGSNAHAFDDAKHKVVLNGFAFLFSEIRYELNGTVIDQTRKPGLAGLIKGLCSFPVGSGHVSACNGFGDTEDAWNYLTGDFYVNVPLNHMLGFCEDFKKVLINIRQELVLIRSNTNRDMLYTTDDATFQMKLTKVQWRIRHIQVNDAQRLKLLEVLSADPWLDLSFTTWELHEMPLLQKTTHHVWSVKTAPRLETPRYVLVCFQTGRKATVLKSAAEFDNIKLREIKLYLNGVAYPYDNLNADLHKGVWAPFYDMYQNFQRSYYGKEPRPYVSMKSFINKYFIVVLDCSKQPETIKSGSVDVHLEWVCAENVPDETAAYCLILHDRFVQYKPLTSAVQIL